MNLEDDLALDKRKNHTIEVVVDRLLVKPGIEHRLELSVGLAMKLAGGLVQVAVVGGEEQSVFRASGLSRIAASMFRSSSRVRFRSTAFTERVLNAMAWAVNMISIRRKVITDWSKPLLDGGLGPGSASQNLIHMLQLAAAAHGFDLTTPFEKFPQKIQNLMLYGEAGKGGKTRLSQAFSAT